MEKTIIILGLLLDPGHLNSENKQHRNQKK